MQATLGYNKTQVERTTTKTVVPGNDIAKLMYYLDCVATVLQYDINSRYRDYKKYFNLTEKEEEEVLVIALFFNPKILMDYNIFILNSRLLRPEFDNEFFKITDERIGIHINEEVMLGGRQVKVLEIMACNENWIQTYYLDPIKNINNMKKIADCCKCIKRNKKCCIIIIVIIVIIVIADIIYTSIIDKKKSK